MTGVSDQADRRRIAAGSRSLEVAVRRSSRARRLTIKVGPDRLPEIVVPAGTPEREIDRALRRHRDWISRKSAELRRQARPRLGLDRPGVVWLHGSPLPIEHRRGGRPIASLRGGRLLVAGPRGSCGAAIERWYRRQARERLAAAIEREADRLGLRPGRISIRDPRTRWGSCSAAGSLSFSWRLLLAPREVLDYVVVHELCHLRELNHSPAFWRLLDAARPSWRSEAGWLKRHSLEVGGYVPRLAE